VSSGRLVESTLSVSSTGGSEAGEDVWIVSLDRSRDSCGTEGACAYGRLLLEDTVIAFVLS
jgi:hypothetical protein